MRSRNLNIKTSYLLMLYAAAIIVGFGGASYATSFKLPRLKDGKEFHVVRQSGKTVRIQIDERLESGTDSACERVEAIVNSIAAKGYKVVVVNKGFMPTLDMAVLESRLNQLASESK